MARRTALRTLSVCLLFAAFASTTTAGGNSHPYFDDQGTLTWYRSLAAARRAARAEGKLIFVEYGRERCGMCRLLCSRVLPDPRVRSRLARTAVGLAADCDHPEQQIRATFRRHLPGARTLPFVAFLTCDGQYVSGFAGSCDAERFLIHLRKAEALVAPQPVAIVVPPPQRRPVVRSTPTPPATPPSRAPAEQNEARLARQGTPLRVPEPNLSGDPDGSVADIHVPVGTPEPCDRGCRPPLRTRPLGPLPKPRIVILPPVRVRDREPARTPAAQPVAKAPPPKPAVPLQRDVEAAASRGEWGRVLKLCGSRSGDPQLAAFHGKAHMWADDRLDFAVDSVAEGRYQEGLAAVEEVLVQMQGETVAIDAARGLAAIRTILELRYLNPEGEVARAVRQKAYDEMRGTRWAKLFT